MDGVKEMKNIRYLVQDPGSPHTWNRESFRNVEPTLEQAHRDGAG